MSVPPPASAPEWVPPPPDEWDEEFQSTFAPAGADILKDRIVARLIIHARTSLPVEFNLTHQTFYRGEWHDVISVDTCHGHVHGHVHLHRYARSTGHRVGDPEHLLDVSCLEDMAKGYDLASRLVDEWEANLQRWDHA